MSNETYETTAQSEASTSTPELAGENAQQENIAAHHEIIERLSGGGPHSTDTQTKASKTSVAVDQLEREASRKTEEAVREGQRDVREMQAAGAEYLSSAIEIAKGYLPTSVVGGGDTTRDKDE